MSAADLQAEIDQVEKEIESRQGKMVPVREAWIEAAGVFLADFWMKAAEEAVKKNAEVSREQLGPAGVKALRAEVEGMTERSEEIARTHLFSNRRELWPDQSNIVTLLAGNLSATYEYYSHGKRGEGAAPAQFIETPFALTAGLIGEVIGNHGLPHGRTFEWDWDSKTGDRVMKARFVKWSDAMGEAMNAYADQVTDLLDALRNLKRLKREKEEGEAADLWNEASG